nr:hypothetical protein StreXyl84_14600 [Streptomyces sp. Xyl84]
MTACPARREPDPRCTTGPPVRPAVVPPHGGPGTGCHWHRPVPEPTPPHAFVGPDPVVPATQAATRTATTATMSDEPPSRVRLGHETSDVMDCEMAGTVLPFLAAHR